MNLTRLERKIILSEGMVRNSLGLHKPYLDHLGVPTIGHGSTMIFGKKVTMKTGPISDDSAKFLLRHDIFIAIKDASEFIDGFFNIGTARQEALVEMAYQLGGPKQRGFVKARIAGNARNWSEMANQMIDSRWHMQTPARCQELAKMIKTNIHPWEIQ